MNYEIDNTKHAKVMVFEAKDNTPETCSELHDLFCEHRKKGWLLLEKFEYVPYLRFVMYWPEFKSNDQADQPAKAGERG